MKGKVGGMEGKRVTEREGKRKRNLGIYREEEEERERWDGGKESYGKRRQEKT